MGWPCVAAPLRRWQCGCLLTGLKCTNPSAQGLDKSFDYKKILKAFKKGELMFDVICHLLFVKPACHRLLAPVVLQLGCLA